MRPGSSSSHDDENLEGIRLYVCDHAGAQDAARADIFESVILPLFLLHPVECPDCHQRWYAFPRGLGPLVEPGRFRNGLMMILLALLFILLSVYIVFRMASYEGSGTPD